MHIFLNGRFVSEKNATVSVFDHGFLYGDGVFETVRAYGGRIFLLERHLERLRRSARKLRLQIPFSTPRLSRLIYRTLSRNRLKDALLRVFISRGPGPIGLDPGLCPTPTVVILPRAFNGHPPHHYDKGIKVVIVSVRRVPPLSIDSSIKSANYLSNILATMEFKRKRAQEGIMLSINGELTEGTISNLFLVKKNRLYTPSPRCGILNGVTRRWVLDLARGAGIAVRETRLRRSDLYGADECFLTNTSMEVMPVVRVGGRRIGNGKPGRTTGLLLNAYRESIRRECRF